MGHLSPRARTHARTRTRAERDALLTFGPVSEWIHMLSREPSDFAAAMVDVQAAPRPA